MKTMRDKMNLTGEQILAIPLSAPEKLFSGDLEIAKGEYHILSRRWHPDRSRESAATAIFQRVTELYRKTRELIEAGRWRGAGVLELRADGSGTNFIVRRIEYFKSVTFELGDVFIGETAAAFSVERQYADLFENAKRRLARFRFANDAMRKEIGRSLPADPEYFAARERLIMILPKPPEMVLLADLLEHLKGALDSRHVGWITNRLYNLACYFEYAGIVHQDISPRTVFVSPKSHGAMLLGGWWYARSRGEPISALPDRTIKFAPSDVVRHKRADARTDLELIRQTGREMLGATAGLRIKASGKIPPGMARRFNGATSGSAVTDYELWRNVLETDFGAPRFARLDIEPNAIYGG